MMAKCPYFEKKVGSYRFKGFICNVQAIPVTMGHISEWTEDYREKYMNEQGCLTNSGNCSLIKRVRKEGREV